MAIVNGITVPIAVKIRKKWGKPETVCDPSSYGLAVYGVSEYGYIDIDPLCPTYGIYQQRKCLTGQRTVRMKFYTPSNPQTVPQQTNRGKFTNAITAWQALTDNQKAVYNESAVGKQMSGYNLFIRQYMLS